MKGGSPLRIPYPIRKYAVLIAAALAVGILAFGGEGALERFFIDARFLLLASRGARDGESPRIAIIRMDARSAAELGVPQGIKWRRFHPAVIDALREAGAALIVFDAMFEDTEELYDARLAEAFGAAGNVIAGELTVGKTPAPLRSTLRGVADLRITLMAGVPRFVAIRDGGSSAPLSVLAASAWRTAVGEGAEGAWQPRSPGFWINFREPAGYFRSFSFADVYHASGGRLADAAKTPLSFFKDRIVFIGLDDPANHNDQFPLPVTLGVRFPGVWGHAFATETVLTGRPVVRASMPLDAVIAFCFLLLLSCAMEVKRRALRASLIVLLPVAAFAGAQALLSLRDLWVGYAPIFTGFWVVLILHWVNVRVVLAARLRRAVGFDPALIEGISGGNGRGAPLRGEATLLISDVRGYTGFVSRTDPDVVTRVMTEYMDAMERCITAQGGYINKYVGDEIVAVFGFPLATGRSAVRAVLAGECMLRELSALIASWTEREIAAFRAIGIGIDAGDVVFTEVGGRTRSQFDIIGDCINGASRIQTLTKEYPHALLISEEAYRRIEDSREIAGSFVRVGSVPIRGQGNRTLYGHVG